jgi:hypothetical protein
MSAPSYSLERATAAAKALADAIRTADATAEDDLIADMIEGEGDAMAGVSRLLRWMAERNAYIAALKEAASDMAERRKRFEEGVDTARAALATFMDTVGLTKLERPEATLSLRPAGPSVVYGADFNAEGLPEELRRWKCEADRPAVKAALEAGEEVPGATLNNGGTVLTVRVK